MSWRPDLPIGEPRDGPTNLPAQLTKFVGRERERREVDRLLSDARLLTLTGAGGIGKTRLALEVAAELVGPSRDSRHTYPDGVWLVELASLLDPTLVPQAVASCLRVGEVAGEPLATTLTSALRAKQQLLILDNCEHLAAACADLADPLLRGCRSLKILATSREPLGVPGESVWRVPSLDVPDPLVSFGTDEIAGSEAVGLFVDRARSVLPAFALGDRNAIWVAEICRRLDGIPLAIELAAALMAMMGPEQIVQRLDDRFRLLVGGSRTSHTRQQTLRATLDWSYQILAEPEQALFRRLAVFAGGWTLEAAETVCAGDGIRRDDVLGLLGRLVDKSLVLADTQTGQARYRLLETLREHGSERLAETLEDGVIRLRHAAYFVALSEQSASELRGPDQGMWSDRLEKERDNLRAALGWCRDQDPETGLHLAETLEEFWHKRGYLTEGRRWLGELLAKSPGGGVVDARALYVAGELALRQGDYAAAGLQLEEALALFRQVGDQVGMVSSLERLGRLATLQGEFERGTTLVEKSLAQFRSLGDRWNIAWTLNDLVLLALAQGDHRRAKAPCEESLAVFQEIGDKQGVGYSLCNLGHVARLQGEHECAQSFLAEALGIFQEIEDKPFIGRTLCSLGTLALVREDTEHAGTMLREASRVLRQVESRYLGLSLCLSGILAVRRGEHARGARLVGAASRYQHFTSWLHPDELQLLDSALATARVTLGDEAFARVRAEGETMTLDGAVEHALEADPTTVRSSSGDESDGAGTEADIVLPVLSPREREVPILISRGLSNREIADTMVISRRTAETHVTHVLGKLGLRPRSQVVVWAVENGLLAARSA